MSDAHSTLQLARKLIAAAVDSDDGYGYRDYEIIYRQGWSNAIEASLDIIDQLISDEECDDE